MKKKKNEDAENELRPPPKYLIKHILIIFRGQKVDIEIRSQNKKILDIKFLWIRLKQNLNRSSRLGDSSFHFERF